MNDLDKEIRGRLRAAEKEVPEVVRTRIEETLASLPDRKQKWRVSTGRLAAGVAALLLIGSAAPVMADKFLGIGAKNNPGKVSQAEQEIRSYSFFYELEGLGNKVQVTLVGLEPDYGPGAQLYYRVPEWDFTDNRGNKVQGFLFVREYKKGYELDFERHHVDSAFSPHEVPGGGTVVPGVDPNSFKQAFESNGVQWKMYTDGLVRGEKDGMYYELKTQGKYNNQELEEFVQHFKKP